MANRVISAYRGNVAELEFRAMLARPRADAGRPLGSIWMRPDGTDLYQSISRNQEDNTRRYIKATGYRFPYISSLTSIQGGSIDATDKVVVIGAGAMGRGLLAPVFAQAGKRISFLDGNQEVIDALGRENQYSVSIGGDNITMTDIHAINNLQDREAAVAELIRAQIVTTSVGPKVLPMIAPTIAKAVYWRMIFGIQEPLNVIFLENLPIEVSDDFKTVKDQLLEFRAAFFAGRETDSAFQDYVEQKVGFSMAIGNYPGGFIDKDPLRIAISGHDHMIPVNGKTFIGCIDVPQVELVDNFDALVCQKLFAFNSLHALVAYMGFAKGVKTIPEAMGIGSVREVFEGAMTEVGMALAEQFGFDSSHSLAYDRHIREIFTSFSDTIYRVGGDPYRKLLPNDRLLGAASLCSKNGVLPENIAVGIAAGINYALKVSPDDDPTRAAHPELNTYEDFVQTICGAGMNYELQEMVSRAYLGYFPPR